MSRTIGRISALLLLAVAANGQLSRAGSVEPAGIAASFTGSDAAVAADSIRLVGEAAGEFVVLRLMLGGPTTSSDLYSFAFDLVIDDPAVAEYVGGSASAGEALSAAGGASLQVLASQVGRRVAVGVTKIGGTGNRVSAAGETLVVELRFRMLGRGATTLRLAGPPDGLPEVLDSSGAVIGSLRFDGAPVTLKGG